jgi:hypothetical protein
MNVLRTALEKIEILPGLVPKLISNLPERYKEMLKDSDTFFKPISLDFSVENGGLMFKEIVIESDAFYLTGRGYVGFNGYIKTRSDIFISKDLSEALIEAVRELSYLQDTRGLITMPAEIEGGCPDISIKPDLDYVIKRLAEAKGRELLESLFKKSQPVEKELNVADPEKEQEEGTSPEEAIIKTIFDIIRPPKQ